MDRIVDVCLRDVCDPLFPQLTPMEERQVLQEVLGYMDSRIDWNTLAPSLALSDLYYALAIELSNLDEKTRTSFVRLLPPRMRAQVAMSQE